MADGIDRRATIALDSWVADFITPFAVGYNNAYKTFHSKLKEQAKKDAERREAILTVAVLALSLCGGSVLTATIGTASLKEGAAKLALKGLNGPILDMIAIKNMERTFRAAHFAASNKTAHFVVGTLWDSASGALSTEVKNSLKENPANFPAFNDVFEDPDNMKSHLQGFVHDARRKLLKAATDVENAKPPWDRDKMMQDLLACPFFTQIPKIKSDVEKSLELTMWMNLILSLDYLHTETWDTITVGGGMRTVYSTLSKKGIGETPTSPKYPSGTTYGRSGMNPTRTRVAYHQIGDVIEEQIDQVHKSVLGKKFFEVDDGVIWDSREDISKSVLSRAWKSLEEMGNLQVRSASSIWNRAQSGGFAFPQ